MTKKLKSLQIVRHDVSPRDPDWNSLSGNKRIVSETEYEEKWGKVVLEKQYGSEGQLEQETHYRYNGDGFLVGEVLREGDGMVMEEKSYEPDEEMRIAREYLHYADGSKDTITYSYDEAGRVIKKETEEADGEIEQTAMYAYDPEGRIIREELYEGPVDDDLLGDMEPVVEKHYKYDEEGRVTETLETDRLHDAVQRKVNGYNDAGHHVSMAVFDGDDRLIEHIRMIPDEAGRPVEIIEENKQKKNTVEMRYDEEGRLLFQEEHDMHGRLVNKIERLYRDDGRIDQTRVQIHMPAMGTSRFYVVNYHYTFFDS